MAFNWVKFPWTNLHDLNLDWIIQTVKTLENNLADAVSTFQEMINKTILNTLTGEGAFNVIKTGNVLINGKNVEMSAGAVAEGNNSIKLSENGDIDIIGKNVRLKNPAGVIQILGGLFFDTAGTFATIANTVKNKVMLLSYDGILQMSDNNNKPVVISGIGTVDKAQTTAEARQNIAASCGYVDVGIGEVNNAITAEANARNTGDAALQSTIDTVIMPLLNARGIRDFPVTGTVGQERQLTTVTFNSENPKSELDSLLTGSAKVRLMVELPDETRYFNMCYKTATEYGFSGMYNSADGTAYNEMIVYNGTTFEIH